MGEINAPAPVIFIYNGNSIVASRVMQVQAGEFPGSVKYSAELADLDLPDGLYEYELCGIPEESPKRYAFEVRRDRLARF